MMNLALVCDYFAQCVLARDVCIPLTRELQQIAMLALYADAQCSYEGIDFSPLTNAATDYTGQDTSRCHYYSYSHVLFTTDKMIEATITASMSAATPC